METESRELAAISRGKIRAGSTDDWKSEQLFVPPLPPTNLRGCHLIRIQYDVFVSIHHRMQHAENIESTAEYHFITTSHKLVVFVAC